MTAVGLTRVEAARRAAEGRANRGVAGHSRRVHVILYDNVFTLFNFLITPMIVLLVCLGQNKEVISVAGLTVVNTIIGIYQEIQAKRALDKISLIDAKKAVVVRGGEDLEIPIEEIVEGDAVRVRSGEPFLADGRMLEADHLEADESLLTGESDDVPKAAGDPVMSGSFCVSGTGVYEAERIGSGSFVNRITGEARKYHKFQSPIQKKLNTIVKFLICIGIALTVLLFANYLVGVRVQRPGTDLAETVKSVAVVIMSLIPQGLVLTVTLIFILGVLKMSQKGALVQKPNAIESMAHVRVICMDKTGTLTQNRLALTDVLPLGGGSQEEAERDAAVFAGGSLERNKTVDAIAARLGRVDVERLDVIPFTSRKKFSGLRVARDGGVRDLVMGAFESVGPMLAAPACTGGLEERVVEISKRGCRVVLLARKDGPGSRPMADDLTGYNPSSLLVLEDEVKPEAGEILEYFQSRRIELKIISGDHPETVRCIASGLGVKGAEKAYTGSDLDGMAPDAFEKAALDGVIFARVTPQHKLAIIRALKKNGRYCAMVGDGVNDALAIKEADLGIAMGSGARITKDVADITLLHDSFEIMPDILSQGERIIRTVQDTAKVFLTKNAYAVLLVLAMAFLDIPFPFIPQHITLINFLTITLPSVYFLFFARKSGGMGGDYLQEIVRHAVSAGAAVALFASMAELVSLLAFLTPTQMARTTLVAAVVFLGGFNFLYIQTAPGRPADLFRTRVFPMALLFSSLCVPVICAPGLSAGFFDLAPLDAAHWAVVAGFVLSGAAALYLACRGDVVYRLVAPGTQDEVS